MNYRIDSMSLRDATLIVEGWAIGSNEKKVKIHMTDMRGREIPCEVVERDRVDVMQKFGADRMCGFTASAPFERGMDVWVVLTDGPEIRRIRANEARIQKKNSLRNKKTERLLALCQMETLQVAWDFYKENGLFALAKKSLHKIQRIDADYDYSEWEAKVRMSPEALAAQRESWQAFEAKPLISVVIPAYNTGDEYLRMLFNSLRDQTYPNLEIIVADGSDKGDAVRRVTMEYKDAEHRNAQITDTTEILQTPRFTYVNLEGNQGIAGNTNAGLKAATGDYIALCDHDDELPLSAFYAVVKAINENPQAQFIYSDEDKIDFDGKAVFEPHFKSDYNPELLTSVNYICHLSVIRKDLLEQVGGFQSEFDGAQDYDFFLRCTEKATKEETGQLQAYRSELRRLLEEQSEAVQNTSAQSEAAENTSAQPDTAKGIAAQSEISPTSPARQEVALNIAAQEAATQGFAAPAGTEAQAQARTQAQAQAQAQAQKEGQTEAQQERKTGGTGLPPTEDNLEKLSAASGFSKEDVLKLLEGRFTSATVIHVPEICYHWRYHKGSTAENPQSKLYAFEAGARAIKAHYDRTGIPYADVEKGVTYGFYHTVFRKQPEDSAGENVMNGSAAAESEAGTFPYDDVKLSIIIPNKDHSEDLDKCMRSIVANSNFRNIEFIVVENNSSETKTFDYYRNIDGNPQFLTDWNDTAGSAASGTSPAAEQTVADTADRNPAAVEKGAGPADTKNTAAPRKDISRITVKVVKWEREFNYSAINNFGAAFATGDLLLLLNNDVEIIGEDAITEMVAYCQRPEIGAVGARLNYEDDTIQHAGVIVGMGGIAGAAFVGLHEKENSYMHRMMCTQDYSAVTAACLMMRKEVFEEVGGLREELAVAFNDIDLCMKIRARGYRVVYDPYSTWHHYESKSRGLEDTPEKVLRFNNEIAVFASHWGGILKEGDPYYHRALTLRKANFALKDLATETIGEPFKLELDVEEQLKLAQRENKRRGR